MVIILMYENCEEFKKKGKKRVNRKIDGMDWNLG